MRLKEEIYLYVAGAGDLSDNFFKQVGGQDIPGFFRISNPVFGTDNFGHKELVGFSRIEKISSCEVCVPAE